MYYVLVYESSSTYDLENWLNQKRAEQYELISFSGDAFVFKHEQPDYDVLFGSRARKQAKPIFTEN